MRILPIAQHNIFFNLTIVLGVGDQSLLGSVCVFERSIRVPPNMLDVGDKGVTAVAPALGECTSIRKGALSSCDTARFLLLLNAVLILVSKSYIVCSFL